MIKIINDRDSELMDTLFELWNGSVRKTHDFLQEEDIVKLYPFVKEGLLHIEKLAILEKAGKIVGFIGVQDHKIEMLFIDEKEFKKGYGKELVDYSIEHFDVNEVSVNEDNTNAKDFYEKIGFKVYDRHELDDQGMPFPILDMKL